MSLLTCQIISSYRINLRMKESSIRKCKSALCQNFMKRLTSFIDVDKRDNRSLRSLLSLDVHTTSNVPDPLWYRWTTLCSCLQSSVYVYLKAKICYYSEIETKTPFSVQILLCTVHTIDDSPCFLRAVK